MIRILIIIFLTGNSLFATIINVPDDYSTIQGGIDASSDGDTVLVQAGTYTQNINYNGKNIVVSSLALTTGDTSYISQTVISGTGGVAVRFGDYSQGIGVDTTAKLFGFTISNGSTAIFCTHYDSPTLDNLYCTNNGSGVTISNSAQIRNCTFTNNSVGVSLNYAYEGEVILTNLIIKDNGNAIGSDESNAIFNNCLFVSNGWQHFNRGNHIFLNCTFSENSGSFEWWFNGSIEIINSILWSNSFSLINQTGEPENVIDISYSDVEGGYIGIGNINNNPLFVDADNYDFNLLDNSPCIDAGDPDLDGDGEDYTTDTDDQDPDGTRLDMGAYYYQEPAPIVSISSSESSSTNASPIPITVTFSIDVTGFQQSDVSVGNGSISSFSGSGSSYSFNISPTSDGLVTVDIPENVAQDDEGNGNLAAQQFSITYDGTSPTVAISSSATSPTETSPIPITVDFSESVTGFSLNDLSVTNGSVSGLSGSSSSYTMNLTPTDDGEVTVDIASDVAQDAAGNGNTEASQFSIVYDSNMFTDYFDNLTGWTNTTNSTFNNEEWYIDANGYSGSAARSDVGGYSYGDQLSQSFTFNSEVVARLWVKKQAGDAIRIYFKVDDTEIWVFGEVGDPGSTWVLKETTIAEGTHTISIETNFAGYAWIDELEVETNFAPVATISSSYTSPTNSTPIPITVNFSKDVTGFTQSDVSVGNGTINNFSGSGSSYSCNITPSNDGLVTIDIPENVAQDDEGNGNLAAQQFSITYDGTSPTVSISSSETSPTHISPFDVTIIFTEPVLDFEQGDVNITNGSLSAFSGADSLYDFSITPDGDGTVSISIAENSAYDQAGNGNLVSNALEIYYDDLPPNIEVNDISEAGTMDTLTISWVSTDVSTIEKHTLFLTNDGQNYTLLDSTAGDVFTYAWIVPNILHDQNRIIIEARDEWGLVFGDTTNLFAIIDNDNPVVTILEPTGSSSIPEYDSLTVVWDATDNIGLDSVQVYYSNDGGSTFDLMGILAGNMTQFSFLIPAGITESAVMQLVAVDLAGNEGEGLSDFFSVTDNTPPTVEMDTPGNVSIGTDVELSWTAEDNSGFQSHHLYFSGATGQAFALLDSMGGLDSVYVWTVPNIVTETARLSVLSYDLVGLTDTDTTDAFTIIDEIPPEVTIFTPTTDSSIPEYEALTVTWEATDNIGLDSVQVHYSNDGGSTFDLMGILAGNMTQFSFLIPAGVTESAVVQLVAVDLAGNEGEGYSDLFSVTDNTPPTVNLDTPEDAVTGELSTVSWNANDNAGLRSHHLSFTVDGGQDFVFIDSVLAEMSSYAWQVPDSLVSGDCQIRIVSYDLVGLSDSDTSGNFTISDGIPPVVHQITPDSISIPEYEDLSVTWDATDNIGLDSVQVHYSNDGGSTFDLMGILAGNMTQFSFLIPAGVTESAVVQLVAVDLAGNEGEGYSDLFSVTDNTPPTVNLTAPVAESVVGIGDQLAITWNDSDNVGVQVISLFYKTSGDWTSITENAENVNEYDWIVPNEPTDNLQIRVIVQDAVGLTDTSNVNNITVEIEYPLVVSVSPAPGKIGFETKEIYFYLSQPLDTSTITFENVLIQSNQSNDLSPTLSYIDSSMSIKIEYMTGLIALDTITITLKNSISNLFGYELDGDGDGEGGDDYMVTFNTSMLADFDQNDIISVEDLAAFVIGLESDDYDYELGPFTGGIPYVYVAPDQQFNIEDIVAFAMMWNWYFNNNTLTFTNYEDEGLPITIDADHDSIYLDIPQDLSAYQVQIQYTPGSFFIGSSDDKDELFLTHEEQELGVYTIMAQPGQSKLIIPIEIRGKDASISISYKGITGDGKLAGKMTKSMTIANIPDEFALYQNYPNPFNPVTTIEYALPEATDVTIVIYDIMGHQVQTLLSEMQEPGYKSIKWNSDNGFGRPVATGVYFYSIAAGGYHKVRKMLLIK